MISIAHKTSRCSETLENWVIKLKTVHYNCLVVYTYLSYTCDILKECLTSLHALNNFYFVVCVEREREKESVCVKETKTERQTL